MYFQKIKLNCLEQIQSFGLNAVELITTKYKLLNLINQIDVDIKTLLEQEVSELYGETKTLSECLLFVTPPGVTQDIHLDGNSLDSIGKFRAALNIPIFNTEHSPMIWYQGDYTAEMFDTQGTKNIKLNWNTGPFEITREYIYCPTLVRVDIPHHIHNPTSKPRLMLSVRFSPILTFIE